MTSKLSKCWGTSQNIQNNAKLQNWSNYNELHRFDVKTIKNVELRSQNIQNKAKLQKWSNYPMTCIDWIVQNDQNSRVYSPNYKSIKIRWLCIDLTSKRSKCWVTSQNIQNKAKLQKWSKSNDLHRFDVKTIKMLSYVAKHSKQS